MTNGWLLKRNQFGCEQGNNPCLQYHSECIRESNPSFAGKIKPDEHHSIGLIITTGY